MIKSFEYPKLFFLLMLFVLPVVISAQDNNEDSSELTEEEELFRVRLAEFSLEFMQPQNSFGDRMDKSALGGSGTLLYQSKPDSPTFIGFDFYYGQFYRVSTTFIDVIQSSRTSVYGLDLIARYYPFNNFPVVDPFIEGVIGGKYLLTGTSVNLINTNESIDFTVESGEVSFSYGFSAGLQMNVYQDIYYLNFKASYLRGTSNGFYALPEDLPNQDLTINDLDFKNAPIDLLRYQIGISFAF